MADAAAVDRLARAWRDNRSYMVDLAFRMLGDVGEAEDVVQESFVRLAATTGGEIDDERGWLTVVTSLLCLDQIRSAHARRVRPDDAAVRAATVPLTGRIEVDPADRITLDDEVRIALLVVLERLGPAERVAFVLHDVFRTPFDAIAETLGQPAATCRQLARRARQKIADVPQRPHEVNNTVHRQVTERFIRACTNGDIDALLPLLHPQVWGTADFGAGSPIPTQTNHGPAAVAAALTHYWRGATMVPHPFHDHPVLLAYLNRTLFALIELGLDDDLVTAIRVTGVARTTAERQQ